MTLSLEDIFAGAGFAAVDASPLQLAICRASEGEDIGDTLTDDAVRTHFGCERAAITTKPTIVVLVCGVRSGKSFLVACGAIRDALAADCAKLKKHERARHAIVAPTVDNANATFRILCGIVDSSPTLRRLVVGEPTADTLVLRRLDGREVEIVVVAAHRGAVTLRSRWLAGASIEEVAFFGAEASGAAVNAESMLSTSASRVLPRTQVRVVSSPAGRQGLLWDLYRLNFGKPGYVLVAHAPTLAMNPSFPAEQIEALRAQDPDAAAREHDARWVDAETNFLGSAQVEAAVRSSPLVRPSDGRSAYVCALDAGFRGNSTTVVVARGIPVDKTSCRVEIAGAWQWTGSKERPLSPARVLVEIAGHVRPFGITTIDCDGHSFDALRDLAEPLRLRLVQKNVGDRDAGYAALHSLVASERIELPPVAALVSDLKAIRKLITPAGFKIDLPRTVDGRHCDFAPSCALAALAAIGRASSPGSRMVAALKTFDLAAHQRALGINDMSREHDLAELRRRFGF